MKNTTSEHPMLSKMRSRYFLKCSFRQVRESEAHGSLGAPLVPVLRYRTSLVYCQPGKERRQEDSFSKPRYESVEPHSRSVISTQRQVPSIQVEPRFTDVTTTGYVISKQCTPSRPASPKFSEFSSASSVSQIQYPNYQTSAPCCLSFENSASRIHCQDHSFLISGINGLGASGHTFSIQSHDYLEYDDTSGPVNDVFRYVTTRSSNDRPTEVNLATRSKILLIQPKYEDAKVDENSEEDDYEENSEQSRAQTTSPVVYSPSYIPESCSTFPRRVRRMATCEEIDKSNAPIKVNGARMSINDMRRDLIQCYSHLSTFRG